jgi:membrane protease YdiL (CAAX protease family)
VNRGATLYGLQGHNPLASADRSSRKAALAEVLLAFVGTHILFRALKHFTGVGKSEFLSNMMPGLVMTVFALTMLALCQRSFALYGLSLEHWRENLKMGLFWGLILVLGGAVLAVLRVRHQPGPNPPSMAVSLVFGFSCLLAIALFILLLRRQRAVLNRVPAVFSLAIAFAVVATPVVVAASRHESVGRAFAMTAWLLFGAGFGEEIFYRGYLQSRLNVAFGRPFRLGEVQFGAGLIITSLLFGFLHALNSVDYFSGRFSFGWGYCVATFFVGLFFGLIRESTGSVWAGITTHGILDLMARLAILLPNWF